MAFSLIIQEGAERGRQFTFDQEAISIGRTPENDLVLKDPGVSRRHVEIRGEGERFWVQDLGSSNGTRLNGGRLDGEQELHAGDELAVGPVILSFEIALEGSTRIVEIGELDEPAAPKALARSGPRAPAAPARKAPGALARRPAPPPSAPARRPAAAGTPARKTTAVQISASERARILRQHGGLRGKLLVALRSGALTRRRLLLAGLVVMALVVGAAVAAKLAGNSGAAVLVLGDRSGERFALANHPDDQVYGFGDELGITVQTRDEARFEFQHLETIPVVQYLRFSSRGVERKEEVEISVNGVLIGAVSPGLGDYSQEQKLKLPKKHLKPGQPNLVVFDSTSNPPGAEPWAVFKVSLDTKPLPGGPPEDLMREALKTFELASQRRRMKDIAFPNLYDAYALSNKALLFLEAIEPKPDLYPQIQQTLRELERALDEQCGKVMLAAKRREEYKDELGAVREYKTGLLWFPGGEHSCRARLLEKIYEYGETPEQTPPPSSAENP